MTRVFHWTGWISGDEKDAKILTDLGIELGPRKYDDVWTLCKVPDEAMHKLDGLWGQFLWFLEPVTP